MMAYELLNQDFRRCIAWIWALASAICSEEPVARAKVSSGAAGEVSVGFFFRLGPRESSIACSAAARAAKASP